MQLATHLLGDSPEKAEKIAKDSCKRDYAPACAWLGAELAGGYTFGRRPAEAFVYLQSSCNKSQPTSCRILGDAYGSGTVPGLDVTLDPIRAESHWALALTGLERSCQRGAGGACLELSDMYASGRGVTASTGQQVDLVRIACKTEHAGACLQIGEMYRTGANDLIVDYERAARWYANACDFGQEQGCRLAGAMLTSRLMALGPVLWDETTDLERVMEIARARLPGPLAAEMFAALGSGHMFLGEPEAADEAFKQALALFAAGDPSAQTAAKLGMATALDAQAKWAAAAAEYRSFLAAASEHHVLLAHHDLLCRVADAVQRRRTGRGDRIVDALDLERRRKVGRDRGRHAFRHRKRPDPLGSTCFQHGLMCGQHSAGRRPARTGDQTGADVDNVVVRQTRIGNRLCHRDMSISGTGAHEA